MQSDDLEFDAPDGFTYHLQKHGGDLETRRRLGDHSIKRAAWCFDEEPEHGPREILFPDEACNEAPPCGGCDNCMIRQAEHYGWEMHYGFLEKVPTGRVPREGAHWKERTGENG